MTITKRCVMPVFYKIKSYLDKGENSVLVVFVMSWIQFSPVRCSYMRVTNTLTNSDVSVCPR